MTASVQRLIVAVVIALASLMGTVLLLTSSEAAAPANRIVARGVLPGVAADSSTGRPLRVEEMIGACPSTFEVALVDADLRMTFEADPTAPTLVCRASAGSADLTLFQKRAYQTVLMMRRLSFTKPLPWTKLRLYDWFVSQADGIRFRSDIGGSFCCVPPRTINIQVAANSYISLTDRWIDPAIGGGLEATMVLFAHEARHIAVGGHTCGTDDNSIDELNAWGMQYYLYVWLARYADQPFLSNAAEPASSYRQLMESDAEMTKRVRFCKDKTASFE